MKHSWMLLFVAALLALTVAVPASAQSGMTPANPAGDQYNRPDPGTQPNNNPPPPAQQSQTPAPAAPVPVQNGSGSGAAPDDGGSGAAPDDAGDDPEDDGAGAAPADAGGDPSGSGAAPADAGGDPKRSLPFTGSDPVVIALIGLLLLALGTAIATVRRLQQRFRST